MDSNRVDILQKCEKDEKDNATCLQYVLIKSQEIENGMYILWACHHGGFRRTAYDMPPSPTSTKE